MVKLMFCLVRKPDVDEAAFHRYWLEEHAPLVRTHAAALGIKRYVQAHGAHQELSAVLAATRGAPPAYDGVAELWFDSTEDLLARASSPEGLAAGALLLTDEQRFIDHSRSPLFMTEEHPII